MERADEPRRKKTATAAVGDSTASLASTTSAAPSAGPDALSAREQRLLTRGPIRSRAAAARAAGVRPPWMRNRIFWSAADDNALRELVGRHGKSNWSLVFQEGTKEGGHFRGQGRTVSGLRAHYLLYLDGR